MSTRTRAELVQAALEILGIVGAGQTASAEDYAKADAALPSLLGELAQRRVVYVADPEAIDAAYFRQLAWLLANSPDVAPAFGGVIDDVAVQRAEARLRDMHPPAQPSPPQIGHYF